jgi:putative FmdB family regulatory protein
MPIYEYQCKHCRFYLEVMQKISDSKLKKCPSCGRNTLQKLVSAPVFRLKGSGWYETDFKSDQERKRNLAAGEKEPVAAESKDAKDAGAKDAGAKDAGAKDAGAKESGGKDVKEAKAGGETAAKGESKSSTARTRGKSASSRPSKPARKPVAAAKSSRRRRRR